MNTMRTSTTLVGMLLLACLPGIGAGQEDSQAPGANPKVLQAQLKGTVETVSMARGMGPATITLRTDQGASHTIRLGPVPFLLQKGFNLTVGDSIEVRGVTAGVAATNLAVEVKNLTSQKTAPYFHDGKVTHLEEAVRLMGRHQLDTELSETQVRQIVAWLSTLTGEIPVDYIRPPRLPE